MSQHLIKQHELAIKGLSNIPGPIDPNFFATMDQDAVKRLRRRFREEKITTISTQNIHMLRDSTIILIGGAPYVKPIDMGTYFIPARKLTPEEIKEQLANELELDRIYKEYKGEAPWGEVDKISKEEFMARKEAKKQAFRATPQGKRIQEMRVTLGREPDFGEIGESDKQHATPEERAQMEGRENNESGLGGGFRNPNKQYYDVTDRQVNSVIALVIAGWTYKHYPIVIYSIFGLIGLLLVLAYIVSYRRVVTRMRSEEFIYNPRSNYSEKYQRYIGTKDRERYERDIRKRNKDREGYERDIKNRNKNREGHERDTKNRK